MYLVKFIHETPIEDIKCMCFFLGKLQITFAWAESMWTSKEKTRRIPVWVSKKGIFFYKLAIGVRFLRQ